MARAAIKAYNAFRSKPGSGSALSPSTRYLRSLSDAQSTVSPAPWTNTKALVSLLERRAAHVVQHLAQHVENPDAGANQRVSRAVTEAFVAAETSNSVDTIQALLAKTESDPLVDLLILVSHEWWSVNDLADCILFVVLTHDG